MEVLIITKKKKKKINNKKQINILSQIKINHQHIYFKNE